MRHHRRVLATVAIFAAILFSAALAAPASASPGWNFETLDGAGGGNGRTTNAVAQYNAATTWRNEPHVFYQDNTTTTLRHAWWNGSAWFFEALDGPGVAGGNGRVSADVGRYVAVTVWNNQPHVFYANISNGTLRHGWWDGAKWNFEALDGPGVAGGNGRTTNIVGYDSAVTVWKGEPHIWYREAVNNRLRHAWWNGAKWIFEDLDGSGVAGGNGRTSNAVGFSNTVTVWKTEPHVWYQDQTTARLRHAWWNGAAWIFENLDGNGVPGGNGRVNSNVGLYNSVTIWSNQPHVFYFGSGTGVLRHGWWNGSAWQFNSLDGPGVPGGDGRTSNTVGYFNAAATWNNEPHVWYQDFSAGRLRHTWWNGAKWLFEDLDGNGVAGGKGRVNNTVGGANTVTIWKSEPHVFYLNNTFDDLRHGWYALL